MVLSGVCFQKGRFPMSRVFLLVAVSSLMNGRHSLSFSTSRPVATRASSINIDGNRLWNPQSHAIVSLATSNADQPMDETKTDDALFADYSSSPSLQDDNSKSPIENAKFGESVSIKRPSSAAANGVDSSTFFSSSVETLSPSATTSSGSDNKDPDLSQELKVMKQRNIGVAMASILLACLSYVWQFTHPITPLQLLATMQSNSAPLSVIGNNGRPTVVDFWAPWCDNCKMAAPTLQKLEQEYGDRVNFVLVNADQREAWPLVERFGVDAIPHVAMISVDGDVETALIGPIPKRVLESDVNALLTNAKAPTKQQLPFQMLDVFANQPQLRRVHFDQP